jgi:NTE family protein
MDWSNVSDTRFGAATGREFPNVFCLECTNLGQRKAAYWSIATPVASYGLADALPMAQDAAATAASMRTRLNPFSPREINLLLRTGYAGADASLRKQGLAINTPFANFDGLPL